MTALDISSDLLFSNHKFFGQAKVASFRRVVGPSSCINGPFYVEVYRVVLQLPDVFG